MTLFGSLRRLNPYQQLSNGNTEASIGTSAPGESKRPGLSRRPGNRPSSVRILRRLLASLLILVLLVGLIVHAVGQVWQSATPERWYHWRDFARLDGYYNGIRTLVPYSEYEEQNGYNISAPKKTGHANLKKEPPLHPVVYDPYQELTKSAPYPLAECFLNEGDTITAPDVYAYAGLPQHLPQPFVGSYGELGLKEDICFDRFGRYGPYGYSYDGQLRQYGLFGARKGDEDWKKLAGETGEDTGADKVFEQAGYTNWSGMDWGTAQGRCHQKNKLRSEYLKTQRHAYVLRTWTGHTYDQHQILAMRAMITELSLKSGGEYDVHLLVHVKDDSIPIWADEGVYNKTLQDSVPKEFWNISTLWSEQQMKVYYPGPFTENFASMAESSVHGAYRSPHFALQWFSRQHPQYDFFWNWEMDLRYTGHYYELNSKIGDWAKRQPRKGLWERSRRFWIPKQHGDYLNFTKVVEDEIETTDKQHNDVKQSGPVPVWGPYQDFKNYGVLPSSVAAEPPTTYEKENYEWGVGEDADLITFNPIFDPTQTNWVFRSDVTGYNTSLPIPPRRAAIITVARMSRRLLDTMHEETFRMKHSMFAEMWPSSVCMHHGLKAVYAPHPVYFDHDWNLEALDQTLNHPPNVQSSVFGWGENNLLGSSFYYNSAISGALWRRWLGMQWAGEGGKAREEAGTGRMCLRSMLLHPVKYEWGEWW